MLKEQFRDDEERIRRCLERDRFVMPPGSLFLDLYRQRTTDNIGEIIDQALIAIEDVSKGKLAGVFRNVTFNGEAALGQTKERNVQLKLLLEDFNSPKLDLRPSRIGNLDIIGNAYEYLISRFAAGAGKNAGEFYPRARAITPSSATRSPA
ncbi:type I restriction-modification system subunit M N-terminal domain-containing protein [Deinococcus detaillensis]|uniref:type I restriction-modification system subunit M N-terminal domain-containing protein n=1 Tax=Deinococcus detaillensis TaxID=2592048 RepID=UPI0021F096EF|nr:type I restriction-modification system subunit M N-terminal domain-containing protein [Deinococcus detaillensis]